MLTLHLWKATPCSSPILQCLNFSTTLIFLFNLFSCFMGQAFHFNSFQLQSSNCRESDRFLRNTNNYLLNQWISDKAAFNTAMATQGLYTTLKCSCSRVIWEGLRKERELYLARYRSVSTLNNLHYFDMMFTTGALGWCQLAEMTGQTSCSPQTAPGFCITPGYRLFLGELLWEHFAMGAITGESDN